MKPLMQGMAGKGAGDRMKMMQQLQASGAMNDPSMQGMKVKKGTGKRLTPGERAKQKREREKLKTQDETQTLAAFPTNQIAGRTGIDPALKIKK